MVRRTQAGHLVKAGERDRRVALIIDGLDHVTRVVGATAGRADPSTAIAGELAALDLPAGSVLVILSQPGAHLGPLTAKGALAFELPPLRRDELQALAGRLGVVDDTHGGATRSATVPALLPPDDERSAGDFVDALAQRSGGNALYATYLCREVLRHTVAPLGPAKIVDALPMFDGTLEAYYSHVVGGLPQGTGVVADILALIDFPVTRGDLREIQPAIAHRIDSALDQLAPVLAEQAGHAGVRIYHESFARFLCRPFASDQQAEGALLALVADWLTSKGLFTDPRAFRFLFSTLARAGRFESVLDLIGADFTARAVAAGFTASPITNNLAIGADCAARARAWPAAIRCIELARAAITFEEESLADPLVKFLDVPMAILGPAIYSERLLHDGRPTVSGRSGLELCAAIDVAGGTPPWAEYLELFEREERTSNTSYGAESDKRVGLAYLRGFLRESADTAALEHKASEHSEELTPRRVARWLKRRDLPVPAVISAICDTYGIDFAERTIEELNQAPDYVLALAERLAARSDGRSAKWISVAVGASAPGSAHRLFAFGIAAANFAGTEDTRRDELIAATRDVLKAGDRLNFQAVPRWLDLCALSARSDTLGLASAESLISDVGWYPCWLRFVVALCRAEASRDDQSALALRALELLTDDLSPFSGSPRACDLGGIDDTIRDSLRRALTLLNDADWNTALDLLWRISEGLTVTLQGMFGGPLPPTVLLDLVVDASTGPRRAGADALVRKVLATNSERRRLYSYLAEFRLMGARLALAANDRDAAAAHWLAASQLMTAYGWHKDITIYELLDSLPSLIARDPQRAREAVAAAQPLSWRAAVHTDGKETRHAPEHWWRLLADADPVALATIVAPALLRDCNMPRDIFDDARLDLWHAQHARADPIVGGALRLTLDSAIDTDDPDLVARLVTHAKDRDSDVALNLVRLLLCRPDERVTATAARSQDRLLRQQQKIAARLNHIAGDINASGIDFDGIQVDVADDQSRPSARGESRSVAQQLHGLIVEPMGRGMIGIGAALRTWRARPYDAKEPRWDTDRFANAVGFRILELIDQGYGGDAETVISLVAAEQTLGDEGRLLQFLGEGFEARGHPRLAAIAFTFAWTRARGGGGWLNFGGKTALDVLQRAARLDSAASLAVIGSEIPRIARTGGLGVCQALVHAFTAVDFGSVPQSTETTWIDVAFSCWNEALKVIAGRLPSVDPSDEPRDRYIPAPLERSLDEAFALATVAGLAHPGREHKRRTLIALSFLIQSREELGAAACAAGLSSLSDPTTASWLLRIMAVSGTHRPAIVRRCAEALRALSVGPHLTTRALARRLLVSIGDVQTAMPNSEVDSGRVLQRVGSSREALKSERRDVTVHRVAQASRAALGRAMAIAKEVDPAPIQWTVSLRCLSCLRLGKCLEDGGRLPAQRRVAPASVVEDLDVFVDGLGGLSAGRPATPVDELALQRAEEALDAGIIPAIAPAAEAALDAVRA